MPRDPVRRRLSALLAAALVGGACVAATGLATAAPASALDNGLVRTPPMGFNDWNAFGCDVDEQLIKQTADLFVSSGLKAAGYNYVNIDDCWLLKSRSADGHLVPDPVKFPDGIKGTADYVHAKGLKLGIYEDAGAQTCAGYPGSLGHEQTDADDFAAWGVDYLKYDNCADHGDYPDTRAGYIARYQAMGDALANTGRKIVYSLCEWGQQDPAEWAGDVGNLWRTTDDINDSWGSLKSIVEQNAPLASAAHPGAWNDPDMLEVGNGGMTDTEYRTHFSLWAEMAAPLLIGTDLRTATPETMAIYTNKDVIAVDQDRLGVQGQVIAQHDGAMVFSKPLANGDRAVALYNSTDAAATVSTTTAQTGLPKAGAYTATDLWSKQTTETAGTLAARVPAHGTVLMRVHANAQWRNQAPLTLLAATSASGYSGADAALAPGASTSVTTTVTDYGRDRLDDVRLGADVPAGWTLAPTSRTTVRKIGSTKSFRVDWRLTAPSDVAVGVYQVPITVTYAWGARHEHATTASQLTVQVVPPAPAGRTALSDDTWVSATNGWGPVEKDLSNGETAAGDGRPLSIRGTAYAKGLGTHATSDVVYYLGGRCSTLTSDVGIDDEEASNGGDVIFQVYADDSKVADSGALTNTSPVKSITADVSGADFLRLHIDPDGANTYDHADWAGPELTCSS